MNIKRTRRMIHFKSAVFVVQCKVAIKYIYVEIYITHKASEVEAEFNQDCHPVYQHLGLVVQLSIERPYINYIKQQI